MSTLVGLRVVRGPDWKWGDQDGGEGNVGTVISSTPSTESKPGTVTVVWDSGLQGEYRGGPDGHHDLRIINNDAVGVKHPGIICDGDDCCWSREIHGIRWECTKCHTNLCTLCFLNVVPHNKDHNQFKRFTINQMKKTATVYSWDENGPESRIKLLGIFPGAKVFVGPNWYYDEKGGKEIGSVIGDRETNSSDQVLIKWPKTEKKIRYKRIVDGKPTLSVKELSFGGSYRPEAFPLLRIPIVPQIPVPISPFSVGDRVQVDPNIDIEDFKKKQNELGIYVQNMEKHIGDIGTVWKINKSNLHVKFKDANRLTTIWQLNSSVVTKLNQFSANQVIRIRNDRETVLQIEKEFFKFRTNEDEEKMEGAVGRVTGVDEQNPEKLYIQFDNDQIYKWLYKGNPLPSKWMELFDVAQPAFDRELVELAAKQMALFFNAVKRGDLRTLKLLHKRHGVDVDALDEGTKNTALQLASKAGFKDLVEWLLDEAQAELEKPGFNGCRALHCAVTGCKPEIMEVLIEKGALLNSQNYSGLTALYFAVSKQFTECIRVLLKHGCDVNIKADATGNTPLHYAVLFGRTPKVIQILTACGRNDWKLRNQRGFNVLHLAVAKDDLRAAELILNNEDVNLSMELMEDNNSTVLHYACNNKNFQMVKLLVDHQIKILRNQPSPAVDALKTSSDGESPTPSLLDRFLEAKDENGMTSLLIACFKKDYAAVDLLLEAGADVAAIDLIGRTALMFAAYSSGDENAVPTKEQAPSIYKFYQNIAERSVRKKMKKHPILYLILYLIEKGCCWEISNDKGVTASGIFMENGYKKNVVDLIDKFSSDKRKKTSRGVAPVCMGQQDECKQPPNFTLSCPHKGIYTSCTKCFLSTIEKVKCGCPDETIVPIIIENSSTIREESDSDDQSSSDEENATENEEDGSSVEEGEVEDEEDLSDYEFTLFKDSTKFGYVKDQLGNKYSWLKFTSELKELVTSYRCGAVSNGCPAVVQRIVNRKSGQVKFRLDSPHWHPEEKRKRVSISSSSSSDTDGSSIEPVPKRGKKN